MTDVEHGHLVEAHVTGPIPLHTAHAVLRDYGAAAFLTPHAAREHVLSGSADG